MADESREDTTLTFDGGDGLGCREFIQAIRQRAFNEGKSRDDAWIADMVGLHLSGPALEWFESLDDDTQREWKMLRQAMLLQYTKPSHEAPMGGEIGNTSRTRASGLNAKRITINSWHDNISPMTLNFPTSQEEWMARGRKRRDEMTSSAPWTVGWYFAEAGEPAPLNAIPTGWENNYDLYSIRVWYEGGLALGKRGRPYQTCYIPWSGKEIPREDPYEILVGDPAEVRWVRPRCGPFTAVEGGFEMHRQNVPLIAQTDKDGSWQPGKVFLGDGQGIFGWRLDENYIPLENIKVLAWEAR